MSIMRILSCPFQALSINDLYSILHLREKVFVLEQTCLYQDIDFIDQEAWHICFFDEELLVAYCRIYFDYNEGGVGKIGRVITHPDYRRKGIGTKLMRKAIETGINTLGMTHISIHAQCYAIPFYAALGFEVTSEEFLEDNIPHVKMDFSIS